MDSQGQFVATLTEASAKALAAGAITRLSESGDVDVETWGFPALVADAQARLGILTEALAAGCPDLLRLDIEWLATTYAVRQVPVEFLDKTLGCLRDEVAERLPADTAAMACSYLDSARRGLAETPAELPSLLVDGEPHVDLARKFLLAALEGRRDEATQLVLDALGGGVSVLDLHQHVLAIAQAEMGRLWQVGDADVAEEHLGSRIVEEALVLLHARIPRAEKTGRCVLVAAVQGNLHDIGARMVADHFEMAGWRSLFLGADTPSDDLVASVKHFKADLVALSAGLGLNIRATAAAVEAIHTSFTGVPVLIGGQPFSALPDLWQTVGADGCAPDAAGAVREGERLVTNDQSTEQ